MEYRDFTFAGNRMVREVQYRYLRKSAGAPETPSLLFTIGAPREIEVGSMAAGAIGMAGALGLAAGASRGRKATLHHGACDTGEFV